MFKVDLKEQNCAYKASEDVGVAEVQCTAVEEQLFNEWLLVTIKEEKPEHLDMWAFKDVVVGEVNILLHWKQRKMFPDQPQGGEVGVGHFGIL